MRRVPNATVSLTIQNQQPTHMKKALKYLGLISAVITLAASASAAQHAFVWTSTGGMQDIGSLGGDSFAIGINDSGTVVGYSYLADGVTYHAFTWTSSTGMVDLGPLPGGTSTQALSINSAGEVVGAGFDAQGVRVPCTGRRAPAISRCRRITATHSTTPSGLTTPAKSPASVT